MPHRLHTAMTQRCVRVFRLRSLLRLVEVQEDGVLRAHPPRPPPLALLLEEHTLSVLELLPLRVVVRVLGVVHPAALAHAVPLFLRTQPLHFLRLRLVFVLVPPWVVARELADDRAERDAHDERCGVAAVLPCALAGATVMCADAGRHGGEGGEVRGGEDIDVAATATVAT
ncbi:hypothetical protein GSI_09242 [Ganoderma sinense ZZ0214-1]|uniref:Uncharacterized protein n=1 Tax=Ganoderma sinense ZZ0214-1 TaxID=1077348 RepID=A0A2G8S600_9APHY|nr:hypothetical protein GSI_09242 [Ganoderma sinense ZZ0214-1]